MACLNYNKNSRQGRLYDLKNYCRRTCINGHRRSPKMPGCSPEIELLGMARFAAFSQYALQVEIEEHPPGLIFGRSAARSPSFKRLWLFAKS